jgi:hypothetical protein
MSQQVTLAQQQMLANMPPPPLPVLAKESTSLRSYNQYGNPEYTQQVKAFSNKNKNPLPLRFIQYYNGVFGKSNHGMNYLREYKRMQNKQAPFLQQILAGDVVAPVKGGRHSKRKTHRRKSHRRKTHRR